MKWILEIQFFGGRGASSGGGGGTVAQQDMIDRIKKNSERQGVITDLKFAKQKDGTIKFTYTNTMTGKKNNVGRIDKQGKVTYR